MFVPALSILAAVVLILLLFQDKMIYHPRAYTPGYGETVPPGMDELTFTTAQGQQTAFYYPPADGKPTPDFLWVLFNGNGGLALEMAYLAGKPENRPRTAYLLVEYPGYGKCEGKPGPEQIKENALKAFSLVVTRAGLDAKALALRTGILGHSLGAAASLLFASETPVAGAVLVAPFTSLMDMAQRMVGPLKCLLRQNYDNDAGLKCFATRQPRPVVFILHGTRDNVIPVRMGEQLARENPGMVRFTAVKGAGHNDIFSLASADIRDCMKRVEQAAR